VRKEKEALKKRKTRKTVLEMRVAKRYKKQNAIEKPFKIRGRENLMN